MNPHLLTPLHLALGAPSGRLTWDHLRQLIDEGVLETAQLDWKRALPSNLDSFAKDIAAMANGEGGVILYGVDEDRSSKRAAATELIDVDISDGEIRRLLQGISGRIRPVVTGLQLEPIPNGDSGMGVLMALIPRSENAPHMVGRNDRLNVPIRTGASTRHMDEPEISRFYRRRFDADASLRERLHEAERQVLTRLDDQTSWVSAVAWPAGTPPLRAPVDKGMVPGLIEAARSAAIALGNGESLSTALEHVTSNKYRSRVGLRRWILESSTAEGVDDVPSSMRVELHHDGGVAIAYNVRDDSIWEDEERIRSIDELKLNTFARDVVGLIAAQTAMHGGGEYAVRVNIRASRGLVRGLQLVGPRPGGSGFDQDLRPVRGTRAVADFVAFEMVVDATLDALEGGRQLATDMVAQFGASRLWGFAGDPVS